VFPGAKVDVGDQIQTLKGMELMYFVLPEEGMVEDFAAKFPTDKAVVMLNLLRFRDAANYPPGDAEPCSGFEAYMRYGVAVTPLIGAVGGELVWQGRQAAMLIGPQDKDWHLAVLVRYPAAEAFVRMVASDEYQAVSFHRTAALQDSRLIAMEEL
jgi:uncharacterized protein (DUF1330 family)